VLVIQWEQAQHLNRFQLPGNNQYTKHAEICANAAAMGVGNNNVLRNEHQLWIRRFRSFLLNALEVPYLDGTRFGSGGWPKGGGMLHNKHTTSMMNLHWS
jgi:hypothetical protein